MNLLRVGIEDRPEPRILLLQEILHGSQIPQFELPIWVKILACRPPLPFHRRPPFLRLLSCFFSPFQRVFSIQIDLCNQDSSFTKPARAHRVGILHIAKGCVAAYVALLIAVASWVLAEDTLAAGSHPIELADMLYFADCCCE